jgi:Nucleotidyl transferase AbiEii toxin, Type IV TA system
MFAPDELIAALSDGGVDYVLIGGLAVGAHGFPRATKDVDIVPAPDDANLERLAGVLREIDAHNFGTGEFDPAEFPFDPRKAADLRAGGNFVLATRVGRLDLMQRVPGVPGDLAFEHLTRTAVETSLGGRPVRVCSRADLIAMKRAAGRPQDLLDLEQLGTS